MKLGHKLGLEIVTAAILLLLLVIGSCNKAKTGEGQASGEDGNAGVELAAAPVEDIYVPSDTEITLVVDYRGWDVETGKDDPSQREHVFAISARWGVSIKEELREIVAKEGESQSASIDIGDGQVLTITPRWNERQRGSYLLQVEDRDSGKLIAAFDARDTDEFESLTVPAKYGHHSKTVFSNLDKRVYLAEVKRGKHTDFSRDAEFGMAYVGEGFCDMPTCKVNDNHHWHFPRFEVVACPREWMARYSFQGLGEKLANQKGGIETGGGVQEVDWDKLYKGAAWKKKRACFSGG